MVSATEANDKAISWQTKRIAGGKLYKLRAIFDANNSHVFCAVEEDVLVIQSDTGRIIHRLPHSAEIVALHCYTKRDDKREMLMTYTNRADVFLWETRTYTIVRYMPLQSFGSLSLVATVTGHIYVLGQLANRTSFDNSIAELIVTDQIDDDNSKWQVHQLVDSIIMPPMIDERQVAFLIRHILWCDGKYLKLYSFDGKKKIAQQQYQFTSKYDHADNRLLKFECVNTRAEMDCAAAAVTTGRILIWYNVSRYGIVNHGQTVHWHQHPIGDLSFTLQGSALISGAGEAVLVKCSINSAGQSSRQFMSRLNGPILRIGLSDDNSRTVVAYADNTLQVIDMITMRVISTTQGFIESRIKSSIGLHVDIHGSGGIQTYNCIVTNDRPGYIQFFNPKSMNHIMSLDISGQNLPGADRLLYGETETWSEVIFVATGPNILATLECRSNTIDTHSDELCIKFWHFINNRFQMITTVDDPHKDKVNELIYTGNCFMTASNDSTIKVWMLIDDGWMCNQIISYQQLPVTAIAAKSNNISSIVLAAAHGSLLVLWSSTNHSDWTLLTIVEMSTMGCGVNSIVRQLFWGTTSGQHQLLLATNGAVIVWDSRSLSVVWIVNRMATIAIDSISGLFAAIDDRKLIFFTMASPKPLLLFNFDECQDAMCFIAGDNNHTITDGIIDDLQLSRIAARFYSLNTRRELIRLISPLFGTIDDEIETNQSKTTNGNGDIIAMTPFARLLAETTNVDGAAADHVDVMANAEQLHDGCVQMLSAPAHTLGRLEPLASRFIDSCLIRRRLPV